MAITSEIVGAPLGLLISQPLIEVAKGQAELCHVYLDQLFKLAFKTMPDLTKNDAVEANVVRFTLNRTVVDTDSGGTKVVPVTVEAPLLALVPVPAFTMDEATVRFTMEVKEVVNEKVTDDASSEFKTGVNYWGISAEVSGKVSTTRENTRESDKSAKYEIYARAAQQPPAEGMAKLSSIFASVIEPITTGGQ